MKAKIGCSDQALMSRKRKILTHVWYQNKAHIKIFKDRFPDFSFYPPTALWEGLKRRHQPIRKFVLSLPKQERVQHGDQSRECRAILRKTMPTVFRKRMVVSSAQIWLFVKGIAKNTLFGNEVLKSRCLALRIDFAKYQRLSFVGFCTSPISYSSVCQP